MAKIKLEDVSFFYGKGTAYCKEALKKVNVEVKEGSITGLIGHTGSGKLFADKYKIAFIDKRRITVVIYIQKNQTNTVQVLFLKCKKIIFGMIKDKVKVS